MDAENGITNIVPIKAQTVDVHVVGHPSSGLQFGLEALYLPLRQSFTLLAIQRKNMSSNSQRANIEVYVG